MRLARQLALTALVIGTSVAVAATERVTVSLVLTSALAWAFVPLIQLLTGLWLVRGAQPERRVEALERYFDTHRPWSLWILGVHAMFLLWPPARGFVLIVIPSCLLPTALTVCALLRVCRGVLGMPASQARRSVMVHQGVTWLVILSYAVWASAYLPRLVGLV